MSHEEEVGMKMSADFYFRTREWYAAKRRARLRQLLGYILIAIPFIMLFAYYAWRFGDWTVSLAIMLITFAGITSLVVGISILGEKP